MKKLLIVLAGITFLFAFPSYIKAEEGPENAPRKENVGRPAGPMPQEQLKEALDIRFKMRKIEEETIKNDQELQKLQDQIMEMQKQLREKIDEKLANNSEYQNLKKQLNEMRKEGSGKRQNPKVK